MKSWRKSGEFSSQFRSPRLRVLVQVQCGVSRRSPNRFITWQTVVISDMIYVQLQTVSTLDSSVAHSRILVPCSQQTYLDAAETLPPSVVKSDTPSLNSSKGYGIGNISTRQRWRAENSLRRARAKWTPDIGRAQKLLDAVKNGGDITLALERWNEKVSSKTLVAVLSSFRDWRTGLNFFNWSRSRRDVCEVTVFGYNMMLKLLRDGHQWSHAEQLLKEMLEENVTPDNYTFTLFVGCSKSCDRAEEAIRWFHTLVEAGVTFDEVTYSSVIDLYGKAGRTAEAMDLYQNLRRNSHWKPDMITFGVMANVYSRVGDYQAIIRLFRDMEQLNVKPNVVLFNTLIGTLGRAGKISLARGMFKEMVESYGLVPSEVTLSIYIDLYTKVGAFDDALEVYNLIKTRNWRCDVMVYNTLLKSCVESGSVERAEHLMTEMERFGYQPDHMTFGILMNVYASKGLVRKVRQVFTKLSSMAAFPKASFYTMLMKACKQAKDFDRIPDIFNEMVASGCSVNERLSGMLMSCAISPDIDAQGRQGILDCISKVNPRLHGLMLRLMNKEDLEGVGVDVQEFLFQSITEASRRPMCNALIDFCWVLGHNEAAHRLLEGGVSSGFYHGLYTSLPSLWHLNLRTLSFCTAECALEAWTHKLVITLRHGEELPQDLMVETGTGRAKQACDSVSLNDVVGSVLKRMNSPFRENEKPASYFIATGSSVKAWLSSEQSLYCFK